MLWQCFKNDLSRVILAACEDSEIPSSIRGARYTNSGLVPHRAGRGGAGSYADYTPTPTPLLSPEAPGSYTFDSHPATILQLPVRACERACVSHGMGLLVEIYREVAEESVERRRGERRAGMQTDSKQVRSKRRMRRVHKKEEEVE